MQIALCDDDTKMLNWLEDRIIQYAEEKTVKLCIDKFCQAKDLKERIGILGLFS